MLQVGLVQRRFGSSADFLDFIRVRASLVIAAGAVTTLAAVLLAFAANGTTADVWFAGLAAGGVSFGCAGAYARGYSTRARATLLTAPRHLRLTTLPRSQRWPLQTLEAIVLGDDRGGGARFRVAWGSFGAIGLDGVPANVYGPLTPGSIVLAVCGEGFVVGRAGRSAEPLAPVAPPAHEKALI
jgi:hypothetical protein